jgi:tryptophan synthase alpha chain
MSDRLQRRFGEVRARSGRALAFFYTAGYPGLDSTVEVGKALAAGGADILELGMPFSDPLADGPVIQKSSEVALRNGLTLKRLMEDVRRLRQEVELPIVLMGYVNPILRYGADRFFGDAAAAGVDGLILPELPIEEAGRFAGELRSAGLAQILLVTPTTPPGRLEQIDSLASGFVYCVSMTGVTGGLVMGKVGEYLGSVRKRVTRNPMMVGFGISAPAQAAEMALQADGVIIGSALIRKLEALLPRSAPHSSFEGYRDLEAWVNGFRKAIDDSLS